MDVGNVAEGAKGDGRQDSDRANSGMTLLFTEKGSTEGEQAEGWRWWVQFRKFPV